MIEARPVEPPCPPTATGAAAVDVRGLVQETRVHRDVYTDPSIFSAEMHRIFQRTWVYVGHDSEISEPGDFKSTWIGREPVILTRNVQGEARVLVNRCSHRGASVCQIARGNASTFRCHYHGWTFASDGKLTGVPFPDGYEDLDKSALGLRAVPLVDSYRGFIFASFDVTVPPVSVSGQKHRYWDRPSTLTTLTKRPQRPPESQARVSGHAGAVQSGASCYVMLLRCNPCVIHPC